MVMEEGNAWTVIGSYPEYIPPLKEFPLVAFIVIINNVAVAEGVWSHLGAYRMVTSALSISLPSPSRHFISWEVKTRVHIARSKFGRQSYHVQ